MIKIYFVKSDLFLGNNTADNVIETYSNTCRGLYDRVMESTMVAFADPI